MLSQTFRLSSKGRFQMTKEQYYEKLDKLQKEFNRKVELLQQEYVRDYTKFKEGDLVRSKTGFKMTCKVLQIDHYAEGHQVYTVLTILGTNKHGQEHSKSRVMKARDDDMINQSDI